MYWKIQWGGVYGHGYIICDQGRLDEKKVWKPWSTQWSDHSNVMSYTSIARLGRLSNNGLFRNARSEQKTPRILRGLLALGVSYPVLERRFVGTCVFLVLIYVGDDDEDGFG